MKKLPVTVTLCTPDMKAGEPIRLIKRFATIAEAEEFLATSPSIDSAHLEAGHYSIDAPETMINPRGSRA